MSHAVLVRKTDLWRAIRKMCMRCCGELRVEVANCPDDVCPLKIYRFGKPLEKVSQKDLESGGE
jgi:hypothetical protein